MTLGQLFVRVGTDLSGLAQLGDDVEDMLRPAKQRIGELGAALSAGITLPLVLLGKAAFDAAIKMDSLTRGIEAVMGNAAAARSEMDQLKEVAKLPGLSFAEAIEGSTNLQATGMSAEFARRSLMAFGNALATVGRGSEELSGVIRALTQIQAKGKVFAEEINQIAERVPQIRAVMLQAFGTANTIELQRMGLTTQEFFEGIVSELEKLPRVTGGLANALENLRDKAFVGLAPIGQAIARFVVPALERLGTMIERVGDWFGALPADIQDVILGLTVMTAAIGPLLAGLTAMVAIAPAVMAAWGMITGPVGLVSAAVIGLAAVIADLVTHWEVRSRQFQQIWLGVKGYVLTQIVGIAGGLANLTAGIPGLGKTFEDMRDRAVAALGDTSRKFKELENDIALVRAAADGTFAKSTQLMMQMVTAKPGTPEYYQQYTEFLRANAAMLSGQDQVAPPAPVGRPEPDRSLSDLDKELAKVNERLSESMRVADFLADVMGRKFDAAKDRVAAIETAVLSLIKAGLDPADERVTDLLAKLDVAQAELMRQISERQKRLKIKTVDPSEILRPFRAALDEAEARMDRFMDPENIVKRMQASVREMSKALGEPIQLVVDMTGILKEAIGGMADAWVEGIGNAITQQQSLLGALGKSLLGTLADVAIQAGKTIFLAGVGIETLKASLSTFMGAPAIAAGLALMAIGAVAKAGLAKAAQGGGGGGGGGAWSPANNSITTNVSPTSSVVGRSERPDSIRLEAAVLPSGALVFAQEQGARRLNRTGTELE